MEAKVAFSIGKNVDDAIAEINDQLSDGDWKLIVSFFWYEYDLKKIEQALGKLTSNFMGGMASRILTPVGYVIQKPAMVALAFSDKVIEKVHVDVITTPPSDPEAAKTEARDKLLKASEESGIPINPPDINRTFLFNLFHGLWVPRYHLDGQMEASFYLRSVGGLAGGPEDLTYTGVVSSKGSGDVSAFALIHLAPEYLFHITRNTSFKRVSNRQLEVTKIENPRVILELNHNSPVEEYCNTIGIKKEELTPVTFATYSLGIPVGDGLLITSIYPLVDKILEEDKLFMASDTKEGFRYYIYQAISQEDVRTKLLREIKGKGTPIAYFSFDCLYCYLSRDILNEVDKISFVYNRELEGVPFAGFATFGEIQDGANVNQTETILAILRK